MDFPSADTIRYVGSLKSPTTAEAKYLKLKLYILSKITNAAYINNNVVFYNDYDLREDSENVTRLLVELSDLGYEYSRSKVTLKIWWTKDDNYTS